MEPDAEVETAVGHGAIDLGRVGRVDRAAHLHDVAWAQVDADTGVMDRAVTGEQVHEAQRPDTRAETDLVNLGAARDRFAA